MFEKLKLDNNYEICTEYPHQIRKISNKRVIKESPRYKNKYISLHLTNGKSYYKHILVATQFIPNPDNLSQIDHKNHDTLDYHINNLRWVTRKDNLWNLSKSVNGSYEYSDTLPDNVRAIYSYNDHLFKDYYFDKDYNFYHFNGLRYRKIHVTTCRGRSEFVLRSIKNKSAKISLNKLKKFSYFG